MLFKHRVQFFARLQRHCRFERCADGLVLTGSFEHLQDLFADGKQLVPLGRQRAFLGADAGAQFARLRKEIQMDAVRAAGGQGGVAPHLFAGEAEDGSQQPHQREVQTVERGLGAAAGLPLGCAGIEAVLQDVEVDGTQVDRGEFVDRVVDLVEREIGVPVAALLRPALQPAAEPTDRYSSSSPAGTSIGFGIEIREVPEA